MSLKVMTGLSGGIDSAAAAWLLKSQGYEVTGVNCRFFSDNVSGCVCNPQESLSAAATAERLGIGFEIYDLSAEFEKKVIDNFVSVYCQGGTPNPCIECNRHLKFGRLCEIAEEKGFDYIATGHYARIEYSKEADRYYLKKGADSKKDQSYVLYRLNQHQLSHTLFPLGAMTKSEIRALAEERGFISSRKKESQDICFIPDGDYASFIERRLGTAFPEGHFTDTKGNLLGTHKGIIRYTIGQRRGLGLALPAPLYVNKKDVENNRVILSSERELYSSSLEATDINLIALDKIESPIRLLARTRYSHKEQWATVRQTDENTLLAQFDEPVRAAAKGQSLVLYDGDYVIGGGIIK